MKDLHRGAMRIACFGMLGCAVLSTGRNLPAQVLIKNVTDVEVCGLAVNPEGSGQVGLSELPPGQTIPPGASFVLDLPAGLAVVEATDCNGTPLADSAGTILIEQGVTYTIDRPGATSG